MLKHLLLKIRLADVAKILLSIGLISYIAHSTDIASSMARLANAALWPLVLSVAVYLICQGIASLRWYMLLRRAHTKITPWQSFQYYLTGLYLSLFMPSTVGGDVSRIFYVNRYHQTQKRVVFASVATERIVGLFNMLVMVALLLFVVPHDPVLQPIHQLSLLGVGVGTLGYILFYLFPVERFVPHASTREMLSYARSTFVNPAAILRLALLSLGMYIGFLMIHLLIAQALGITIAPLYLLLTFCVISLAGSVPISFNGLGLREGAYLIMLSQYGLSKEIALSFGMAWFLITLVGALFGGLTFLLRSERKTAVAQHTELNELGKTASDPL